MDALTIAIFTLVLLLFVYLWRSPKKNLPPGPRALPLLGNVLSILRSGDLIGYVEKLRKQYGQVFTMWFGPTPTIVVSGYKNVHDVFVTKADVCSGRPQTVNLQEFCGGHGIFFQDGEPWKHMRRFTLTALRDLGFGKRGTEEKIIEEVSFVVAEIDKFSGKSWPGSKILFNMATSNVICSLIFGLRFQYTDAAFNALLQKLRDALRAADSFSIFDVLPPSLSFLKPKFIVSPLVRFAIAAKAFAREQIDQHRKTYDADDIRDYVDYYLKVTSEGREKVTEEDMFAAIIDLFLAGTETSATALDWGILYMMGHPDIQTRCQQEIDNEVGRNRAIRVADKKSLPFVEATICEILRISSFVPMGVLHRATGDFKLCGYDIPKGTNVLSNLFNVMHDPEYWEDPDVFNPNRFLSADGGIVKHTSQIPFSIGPRVCLGETLARTEVFVFFANLLQNFRFSKVPGDKEDYLSQYTCPSIIRGAVNYQTKVTRRE